MAKLPIFIESQNIERVKKAIEKGIITSPGYAYIKDIKQLVYIDTDLNITDTRNSTRTFKSYEEAVEVINSTACTYAGENVSVFINGLFKIYIVNGEPGNYTLNAQDIPGDLASDKDIENLFSNVN